MRILGDNSTPLTNQPDKIESPQVQAPAVTDAKTPVDEQLSSKYAELAKREKITRSRIQAREQAIKAREDALAAKEKEYSTSYVPKAEISKMFRNDPHNFMKDYSIDGDQLTQTLLNQPSPQDRAIIELQQQIAALKGLPDQTKSLFEEREKQQREQAIQVIRADVKALVSSDPQFEIIKGTGSEDEVVKKIEDTLDKEGIILSAQEAAEAVEKDLVAEISKLVQLKKIQDLFKPAVQAQNPQSQDRPQTRTLAHSQVSSAQSPMNARERAIALLEGKQI